MLNQILKFKQDFLKERRSNINNIDDFEDELFDFYTKNPISGTSESIWSNYIHATLVSCLQEILGYSLINWNAYNTIQKEISELLNIKKISQEGIVLELFVLHTINHVFSFGINPLKIHAYRSTDDVNPTFLTDDTNQRNMLSELENKRIIGNIKTVMKIRGQEKKAIWGDNDIIVLLEHENKKQQFCIISCKTSLRERVYQSVFWSLHSRLQGVGKHVFVTADKGASGKSEIGIRLEDNSAKKSRDVLESTMDRVYVLRNAEEVNRSQVIKDFDQLQKDLILWAHEIAGV